jgi:hypothetical protein
MITGDRSEVKRLVKLVTTWIFEDPCIMIVQSLLSGRKGGEIVFRVFFLYTGCSQILTSETDGVVKILQMRSPALVGRAGRHYAVRDIYAEYDAVYQRFGDTYCVHLYCRSVTVAAKRPVIQRQWS